MLTASRVRQVLVTVLAGIFLIGAAPARAVVIDFDTSGPQGTLLPVGTFDALGVRFDQVLEIYVSSQGAFPSSLPNVAATDSPFGSDITGFFLGPLSVVDFISVFAGDDADDIDTVTLTGYDAANAVVDSNSFTGLFAEILSISGPGIVRFTIVVSGLVGIDDFTFTPSISSVPEPGTLALFGIGLAGLGFTRRRKAA